MDNGETITLSMNSSPNSEIEEDIPIEEYIDEGEEEDIPIEEDIDEGKEAQEPDFETLIQHDCNNIKEFNETNVTLMPKWIEGGKGFGWFNSRIKKRIKNNWPVDPFVKYNYAYGIPIFGTRSFSDDSMKRACYLVRFLFADNEHFRRHAFKRNMIIKGMKGGFCCPPNVGNAALACSCKHDTPLYVIPPEHEMSHWYIQYVLPEMQKAKPTNLILPPFKNSTLWSWKLADDSYCSVGSIERNSRETNHGKVDLFLWNSQLQRVAKQNHRDGKSDEFLKVKCTTGKMQHFMDYQATLPYLSLFSRQKSRQNRENLAENNENMLNLLNIIWPCKNNYISVCEDSVHNMTKGLGQKLLIGRSVDESDPNKMECEPEKNAEIKQEDIMDLPSVPDDDVYEKETKTESQGKCQRMAANWGWQTKNAKWKNVDEMNMKPDVLSQPLKDGNEYAWYLRKCCAKSAGVGLKTETEKAKKEWEEILKEGREKEEAKCCAPKREKCCASGSCCDPDRPKKWKCCSKK